jgi:ferritin heavy chain
MKLLAFVALFACVHLSYQQEATLKCSVGPESSINLQSNIEKTCSQILKDQIKKEFKASITYMAMAAYFSRETHFRPGLSKFFLKSASEERTHAKKIMEFLLMRGVPIAEASLPPIRGVLMPSEGVPTAPVKVATKVTWTSAEEALREAYRLEQEVTDSIVNILKTCEGGKNDYHAVDYITADFLAEQHEGLRAISEYITSLKRMGKGALGEILFDKTLLKD